MELGVRLNGKSHIRGCLEWLLLAGVLCGVGVGAGGWTGGWAAGASMHLLYVGFLQLANSQQVRNAIINNNDIIDNIIISI